MNDTDTNSGKSEFRRFWGVLLAAHIGVALGIAPLGIGYTLSVFAKPLAEAFSWSRAEVMFVPIPATIGALLISPVIGWITDRYGVRRVVIFGQIALGVSFMTLGLFLNNLASYYAIYFIMHIVAGGTAFMTFAKCVTAGFDKGRGLALGIALSGTGMCGLIVPSYLNYFVEIFGWREGFFALAVLPILVALPISLFFLREPREIAASAVSQAAASQDDEKKVGDEVGLSVKQGLRHWRFWLLGGLFASFGFFLTGLLTNLVPLLTDNGYSTTVAAGLLGAVGLSGIAGRIGAGLLVDRFWAPGVGAVLSLLPLAACMILLSYVGSPTLVLLGVIAIGLTMGAEVDLNAYMTSRYFGMRSYGQLFAGQYMLLIIGGGPAAAVFGWTYDVTGDYDLILSISAVGFAVTAGLMLMLGKYPKWSSEREAGLG